MREVLSIRNYSGSLYTIVYPTLASAECPRSWLWLSNPVACDVGISLTFSQPDIKIIPVPLCYRLLCKVASGIRMTLVSGGLEMVTGLEKDLANEKVRSQLIVFGTIHRTAVSMYNHQLPCVGAGLCKPCQRPSRQHVLNASYTLTQILCTTTTCHVER